MTGPRPVALGYVAAPTTAEIDRQHLVGNRVRVNVQLMDAVTEAPLWVERYDRTLDDIFVVQDDIAGEVVKALNRHARFIRGRLGHLIELRFTPELHFRHDDSFNAAARMNRLFDMPMQEWWLDETNFGASVLAGLGTSPSAGRRISSRTSRMVCTSEASSTYQVNLMTSDQSAPRFLTT